MTVTVRFAPSPTGKLHVGNIRAALWNWLYARKEGGRFVLRIDDTDLERSTQEYEEGIRRDLAWLGLVWDDSFRQSARFPRYDEIAAALRAKGLLYPCYETGDELERKRRLQRARGLPPVYDRAALQLSDEQKAALEVEGRRPHWRFKLSGEIVEWDDLIRGGTHVDTASVSDPVLIREDGMYLYTLPSCIDDIDFGITHVIRGEDHVTNAGVQIEIMRAVISIRGFGAVPCFAHHSLLVGADGQGLSKRLGSLSIEGMRNDGIEPAAITSLLAKLGTSDPVLPQPDIASLINSFDFARIGRAPARFDEAELLALNARILHDTAYETISGRLREAGVSRALWEAVRGNVSLFSDVLRWRDIIEGEIDPVIEDKALTDQAAKLLPDPPLGGESWDRFTRLVAEKTGAKGRKLYMPLRLALTGQAHGPEMAPLFVLIGIEKARARLGGVRA